MTSRAVQFGALAGCATALTQISIFAVQNGDHPKAGAAAVSAAVCLGLAWHERKDRSSMQTERIPLPAGDDGTENWAEIRVVSELRARDRKAAKRAMIIDIGADGSHVTAGAMDDMREALIARVITAWSYELPLPVADPESLGELPMDAYDALVEATKEHWAKVDFKKEAAKKGGVTSSA